MAPVGQPSTADIRVLHAASFERLEDADILLDRGSWAMAMYCAGVAVESILQAYALRSGAPSDARHDLRLWLLKCPQRLVDSITGTTPTEWSFLNGVWSNSLRYLSRDGLLGYLRARDLARGIKLGHHGSETILRVNAARLIQSARTIHGKGVVLWARN